MKNLTRQNPRQLIVAQELINKVKSKCCGIKVVNLGNRFSDSTDDRRQKAYDKWRKKPQNAKYNKLKSNLIEKEKELDLIKEKLHVAL